MVGDEVGGGLVWLVVVGGVAKWLVVVGGE